MGKCWLFEEMGEVSKPKQGDWIEGFHGPEFISTFFPQQYCEHSILKLTEYRSSPLTQIREVWERYRKLMLPITGMEEKLWQAIQRAMEIAEGKR